MIDLQTKWIFNEKVDISAEDVAGAMNNQKYIKIRKFFKYNSVKLINLGSKFRGKKWELKFMKQEEKERKRLL